MKAMRTIVALAVLGIVGVGSAWADHRGHAHFGVFVGPYWGPLYYPYYYPPVVIERTPPPVYIEQAAPPPPAAPVEAAPTAYWYYCAAAAAYYPYVKQCPGGWQKVLPRPADEQ